MKTNIQITEQDLEKLSFREKEIIKSALAGEPVETTALHFRVSVSSIHGIRKKALARIARANKLEAIKQSGDKDALYALKLDEVFPPLVCGKLMKAGLETLGHLRGKSISQLLKHRGVGKTAVNTISKFFAENGLEFQFPPVTEKNLEEQVAEFIFDKFNGKRRGFGMGAASSAASLAIGAGLVTEESFKKARTVPNNET
jgi:NAD-dependent DNA ligase